MFFTRPMETQKWQLNKHLDARHDLPWIPTNHHSMANLSTPVVAPRLESLFRNEPRTDVPGCQTSSLRDGKWRRKGVRTTLPKNGKTFPKESNQPPRICPDDLSSQIHSTAERRWLVDWDASPRGSL